MTKKRYIASETFTTTDGTVYTVLRDANGKQMGMAIGDSTKSKPKSAKQPKVGSRQKGKGPASKDRYYKGNGQWVSYARAKQLKII